MTICRYLFTDRETEARALERLAGLPTPPGFPSLCLLLRKMVRGVRGFPLARPCPSSARFQATCFLGSAPW